MPLKSRIILFRFSHQHFLINLKTFVLSWCRMLMLFCNMYVIYFSWTCWISLLIMASNLCWRLNSKELLNDFKYIYFSRVYFNISRDILIFSSRPLDLHVSLYYWNVWIHKLIKYKAKINKLLFSVTFSTFAIKVRHTISTMSVCK